MQNYENIVSENFYFIEKQCYRAISRTLGNEVSAKKSIEIENETLELTNRVLDKLKKDNFRILREYQGKAKITTYLTAIIANQAVDLIRSKKGRKREKERAKAIGSLGMRVYELTVLGGFKTSEAWRIIKNENGIKVSLEEIEAVLRKIRGRTANPHHVHENSTLLATERVGLNGEGRIEAADFQSNPEAVFLEEEKQKKISEVIHEVFACLSGEERLLLRMRFPGFSQEEAVSVAEIGKMLDISQKAVYKRIDRIIKKCRRAITDAGLNIDDLL